MDSSPTPAPSAALVVHPIADLLDANPPAVTAADLLALIPTAGDPGAAASQGDELGLAAYLCQTARPYEPVPAREAAIMREAYCLVAIAVLWSDYVDTSATSYAWQGALDDAYGAAATVYGYAVGELGPEAKSYFDAALMAAFGATSPAASPDPSSLRPKEQLVDGPHERPRPADLATTHRDAIAVGAGVLTRDFAPIGGTIDGTRFVPGHAGCAYQAKAGRAVLRLGDQLGNCYSASYNMYLLYRRTGSPEAWTAAKVAFEMGYANARTDCSGWICRNEYLDMWGR